MTALELPVFPASQRRKDWNCVKECSRSFLRDRTDGHRLGPAIVQFQARCSVQQCTGHIGRNRSPRVALYRFPASTKVSSRHL